MPAAFDKLVDEIKKSMMGKENPRTKKPYTESDCYAIAVDSWKKSHGGKAPSESKRDWHIIEFIAPITMESVGKLTETNGVDGSLQINGIAINETITRNGVKYTAEELEKAAPSLADKPILKDHRNEVDAIIGRTRESWFDKSLKALKFKGSIMDAKAKEMITDGRLKNVSIGARVEDLVEETVGGEHVMVAKGMEILELSATPVPGDAHASLAQALTEAYDLKLGESKEKCEDIEESNKENYDLSLEAKKMENDKVKEDYEAKLAEMQKLLAEKDKAITEIKESADQKELASLKSDYKKLAEIKGAKVREDVDKLSKESIQVLIETLESIKIEEKATTKSKVVEDVKKSNAIGILTERVGYGKDSFWMLPNAKGEYVINEVKA